MLLNHYICFIYASLRLVQYSALRDLLGNGLLSHLQVMVYGDNQLTTNCSTCVIEDVHVKCNGNTDLFIMMKP